LGPPVSTGKQDDHVFNQIDNRTNGPSEGKWASAERLGNETIVKAMTTA
jgi:hypothetical protein